MRAGRSWNDKVKRGHRKSTDVKRYNKVGVQGGGVKDGAVDGQKDEEEN